MGSKGQITMYIILGLVLLVLVASMVYVRQFATRVPSKSIPSVVADAPAEVQSLFAFVTSCVEQVGEDGLRFIGSQGGYVAPQLPVLANAPTESEMVRASPNSPVKVPYWLFMHSKNDCVSCVFNSHQPLLRSGAGFSGAGSRRPSIQHELEGYVDENLASCVQGFKAFPALSVSTKKSPKTAVTITSSNVLLEVSYPLVVSSAVSVVGSGVPSTATKSFHLDGFVGALDVRLQELYEIADVLTKLESEHQFLEHATKNLITGFSRVSADSLPPLSATELGVGSGVFWVKSDVQRKLTQILSSYIPLLQVWGADSFAWRAAPKDLKDKRLFELFYNRDMLVPLQERHAGIGARFSFLDWWPLFFDLNCRGELCGPDTFQNTFGFVFGMQKYAFAYDVSAPILVQLSEPAAFHGRNGGFSFNFMLELNLRNNNPVSHDVSALPVRAPEFALQGSLLCEHKSSAPVTVHVFDRGTKKPVAGFLSFSCGDESCPLGAVESTNGSLTARLPVCFGGLIEAVHEGYAPQSRSLTTSTSESSAVEFQLEPVRELGLDVQRLIVKKQSASGAWLLDPTSVPHGKNDQTVVSLTPLFSASDVRAESVQAPVVVEVLGDVFASRPVLRITPGDYNVSLITISSDALTIAPQERCAEVSGEKKCVRVPAEPVVFDASRPLPVGGSSFVWHVLPEQLDGAKKVTFFTLYSGVGSIPVAERVLEDAQMGASLPEQSGQYASVLTPVLT